MCSPSFSPTPGSNRPYTEKDLSGACSMKLGHSVAASSGRKWTGCSRVTRSAGSLTIPPSMSGTQAPAATTNRSVRYVSSSVATSAVSPCTETARTAVRSWSSAPPATAARTKAATERAAQHLPPSGWNSTGPVNAKPPKRSAAASGPSSSWGTPAAASAAAVDCTPGG
jgi:hypothetical protein